MLFCTSSLPPAYIILILFLLLQAGRWDDDAWQTIVDDERLDVQSQTQELCEELDRARRALAEKEEELKKLKLEMAVTPRNWASSAQEEGNEETAQDSPRRGLMSLFRLPSFTKRQISRETGVVDKTAADKDSCEWAISPDKDTEEQPENAQDRKDSSALDAPARPLLFAPQQAWATDSSDEDDADEMPMVEFSTRTQQRSPRPVTQMCPERAFESSSQMTANVVPDKMPLLGANEKIFAGDAPLSGESHGAIPSTITKPGMYKRAVELIVLSLQQMEIEHLNDHQAVTAATTGTTIGISYDEGDRRVTAVMVGGPAFNSKRVFKGEEIVAVDGRKVIGSELMTLLKGSDKPGSAVELTLLTTAVKPAQSDCENCLLTSQIYEISDRSSLAGTNQDSKTPKNGEPCHRR